MRTIEQNQAIAENAVTRLKAAVILNDPAACIRVIDRIESDPDFFWDDVNYEVYEEWDEISTEANDIILEHSN